MEFTNEIYFDKNLIENNSVKISYTGKLFREFSNEVYIVFGYGPNWNNTQEQKMILTEDCFYAEINITGIETFNFCFRNNYNIWDNNNTFNYIATIYPEDINNKLNNEDSTTSTSIEYIESSNESTEENSNEISEASEDASNESSTENFQNEVSNDVFSELLESLLNDMDISNDSTPLPETATYGLQNIETIESTSSEELNELFNAIYPENTNTFESYLEAQNINESDLDALFDKVFNYEEPEQAVSSELEELMNNILNSVLESDSINDNIVEELDNTIVESSEELLPAVISTSKIDMFFDASYKFLQNVGMACRKIGRLIKLKALEYGFIKED